MKKQIKIIIALMLVLCVLIGVCFLAIWRNQENLSMDDMLKQYVKEYQIEAETDENGVVVTITAPDFVEIALNVYEENGGKQISVAELKKEADKNSDLEKNYTVTVDEVNQENLVNALASQIEYEFLMEAIVQSGVSGEINSTDTEETE